MHIRIGVVVATSALALAALGSATAAPARKAVAVNIAGPTHLDTVVSPFVLQDVGTVSGSPVGSGDITLIYTLMPKRGVAVTTFTITIAIRTSAIAIFIAHYISHNYHRRAGIIVITTVITD
jgi:hypothetical protein